MDPLASAGLFPHHNRPGSSSNLAGLVEERETDDAESEAHDNDDNVEPTPQDPNESVVPGDEKHTPSELIFEDDFDDVRAPEGLPRPKVSRNRVTHTRVPAPGTSPVSNIISSTLTERSLSSGERVTAGEPGGPTPMPGSSRGDTTQLLSSVAPITPIAPIEHQAVPPRIPVAPVNHLQQTATGAWQKLGCDEFGVRRFTRLVLKNTPPNSAMAMVAGLLMAANVRFRIDSAQLKVCVRLYVCVCVCVCVCV